MYLILMYIDISLKMFTLIDGKGCCIVLYVYIFIYVVTPVLLLQGLVLSCDSVM